MECAECGATFAPKRYDQRFCSTQHANKHRQRSFQKFKTETLLTASSELDNLRQENEELRQDNGALRNELDEIKKQSDHWKEVIRRHHKQLDDQAAIIEKLENDLERIKKEKHLLMNRPQTKLNREHLQDVLNKELRAQFPKAPEIQAHIGAIRTFNASYINALVTT